MTELEPILQTSSDELELGLLRSAAGDEPSPLAMSRTAVALGLGGLALSVANGAGAAAAGTTLASSIWISALKALAIGVTGGLIVAAGAQAMVSERSEQAAAVVLDSKAKPERNDKAPQAMGPRLEARSSPGESEGRARPAEALTPALPSDPVTNRAAIGGRKETQRGGTSDGAGARSRSLENGHGSDPTAEPARTASARAAFDPLVVSKTSETEPAPRSASTAPSASANRSVARTQPTVSIAEEVRTVDRARQALSGGRPREALSELDRYQSQWPRGVFTSEVLVLRVEAKLKLGERASAEREARALIAAQPKSRHAARLRALLGIVE